MFFGFGLDDWWFGRCLGWFTVPVVAPFGLSDSVSGGFHVGCDDEVSVGLPHGVCALGEGGAGGVDELLRLAVVGYEFVYEGQSGDCENAHQHGGHSSVLLVLWNWCVKWISFCSLLVSHVFGLSC